MFGRLSQFTFRQDSFVTRDIDDISARQVPSVTCD
jgi:hypothetical protein